MVPLLTDEQVRVLGALVEKQVTTPEYYPLTLNALIAACNQKSSRDPVVTYDEEVVRRAIDALREHQLARIVYESSARAPKYAHAMTATLRLDTPEMAVMCVLMLRGAQTVGEIRGRTGRMHEFHELSEVEQVLRDLAEREGGPLVKRLERQSGLKEARYAQLLAGEPAAEAWPAAASESQARSGGAAASELADRIDTLEQAMDAMRSEVSALRAEADALRQELSKFRAQFE